MPTPAQPPLMPDTLQWLPGAGRPEQLMILLHGWGDCAAGMAPLARALRAEFPNAALLAPDGFEPMDAGLAGRQWFAQAGATGALSDADQAHRVAAVLPRLADWVHAAQAATGVGPAATALVGFSQGAVCALELAQLHDGLAGRVLSFSGRYATLPDRALAHTTLHFLHGATDTVIPADQARLAMQRQAALHGDATIDIAAGIGHELPPVLMRCAIDRLRTHIPHRTWAAALGAVPGLARRQAGRDDDRD